ADHHGTAQVDVPLRAGLFDEARARLAANALTFTVGAHEDVVDARARARQLRDHLLVNLPQVFRAGDTARDAALVRDHDREKAQGAKQADPVGDIRRQPELGSIAQIIAGWRLH